MVEANPRQSITKSLKDLKEDYIVIERFKNIYFQPTNYPIPININQQIEYF